MPLEQPSREHRDFRSFIRANTAVAPPPLIPELQLRLATKLTPLWHATETWLGQSGLEPPFWAFAWAGGQALARLLLDQPHWVRDHAVLDFGTGGGLVALAAAYAGATRAIALDIDPWATAAAAENAALNRLPLTPMCRDVLASDDRDSVLDGITVILAADVCYERAAADRITVWLRRCAAEGRTVLLADPGRQFAPTDGLSEVFRCRVPVSRELEDRDERDTAVWKVI